MKNIRPHSFRNGSALLIVLGMLAFMVVSAVAFSAYMRASRLPSSYLRRTVASRLLVKAALAEAMERLDYAIGDNPYPGVGVKPVNGDVGSRRRRAADIGDTLAHNYFYHHVFIGTNGWLAAEDTVSVLNLEALAYLPPPLVNEARYYSRLSPAATWHWLSFDAGRYAYAAIDVSDYFDVNRLAADLPRDSGANRISLAYLFENKAHTGYEVQPQAWDDFVDRCFSQSGGMPFVSVADLNLAMGDSANSSPVKSPFCEYIAAGTKTRFVSSSSKDEQYRNLAFVTDSYFPAVAANGDIKDLANPNGQPFDEMDEGETLDVADSASYNQPFKPLSLMDKAALWDYLDTDDVPLSLAVPTVEQNPMIAQIVPQGAFTLATVVAEEDPVISGNKMRVRTNYKISPALLRTLPAVELELVYPFKYVKSPAEYEVEVSASVFFCTTKTPRFCDSFVYPDKEDVNKIFNPGVDERDGRACVFRAVGKKSYKPKSEIAQESDAVEKVMVNLSGNDAIEQKLNETPAFYTITEYEVDEGGQPVESSARIVEAKCQIVPLQENGEVDGNYTGDVTTMAASEESAGLFPCLAIVARVRNKDCNKYVDLVPAGVGGDSVNPPYDNLGGVDRMLFCPQASILPFRGNGELQYNATFFKEHGNGAEAAIEPAAIICKDPRYNHNPGDWVALDSTTASWLDNCGRDTAGSDDGKDDDIFMSVSNQGYMQSLYELAFIPRFTDLAAGANAATFGRYQRQEGIALKEYNATPLNERLYWRTYGYVNEGTAGDLTNTFKVVSGSTVYKVNPYAQSLDSIMAAFANTPCCWAAASTNQTKRLGKESDSAAAFNKRYTFQELKWEDLEDIASEFQQEAQQQARDGRGWENAWEDLDWDAKDSFLGIEGLPALHSVDRKFLYGYWRDSFANQQQLFLVFVRAEPTMMGGGAVGQTPPALGARAVALVWRDPEAAQPNEPHRMRILFYRQFE